MFESMFSFWVGFGAVLVFAEIILPGLVSVFVGLAAFTVALLMHYGVVETLSGQLITWFVSSLIYIFSLRLLVMRFYPSDTVKQDIDEDKAMIGQLAEVVEKISGHKNGRIQYGDTSWVAIAREDEDITVGEKVTIVGRDNISWIVKKNKRED